MKPIYWGGRIVLKFGSHRTSARIRGIDPEAIYLFTMDQGCKWVAVAPEHYPKIKLLRGVSRAADRGIHGTLMRCWS